MIVATSIAAGFLALGALAASYRIVVGPSVADRMVALDTLLFIGVGAVAVFVARTGSLIYIPVLAVAVLVAFIGTVVVARYIEAETDQ